VLFALLALNVIQTVLLQLKIIPCDSALSRCSCIGPSVVAIYKNVGKYVFTKHPRRTTCRSSYAGVFCHLFYSARSFLLSPAVCWRYFNWAEFCLQNTVLSWPTQGAFPIRSFLSVVHFFFIDFKTSLMKPSVTYVTSKLFQKYKINIFWKIVKVILLVLSRASHIAYPLLVLFWWFFFRTGSSVRSCPLNEIKKRRASKVGLCFKYTS